MTSYKQIWAITVLSISYFLFHKSLRILSYFLINAPGFNILTCRVLKTGVTFARNGIGWCSIYRLESIFWNVLFFYVGRNGNEFSQCIQVLRYLWNEGGEMPSKLISIFKCILRRRQLMYQEHGAIEHGYIHPMFLLTWKTWSNHSLQPLFSDLCARSWLSDISLHWR